MLKINNNILVDNNKNIFASNLFSQYGAVGTAAGVCELPPGIGSTKAVSALGFNGGATNTIQRFPFSSVSVTSFTPALSSGYYSAGSSSSTTGYIGSTTGPAAPAVQKFSFANEASGSNLPFGLGFCERASNYAQSVQHTYFSCGIPYSKFPHALENASSSVGNQPVCVIRQSGVSSSTNGYFVGGCSSIVEQSLILKFPFATDTNTSCIGALVAGLQYGAGSQSPTNGYNASRNAGLTTSYLQRFPFSTDTSATCIGSLSSLRYASGGHSSTTDGYISGGFPVPNGGASIDRFPFSTNANSTCIGALAQCKWGASGHSV